MLRHAGSIAVLISPLSISSLQAVYGPENGNISEALAALYSALGIKSDENGPVLLHHPSYLDFLVSDERSKKSNFWVDEKQAYRLSAKHSLQIMSRSPKDVIRWSNLSHQQFHKRDYTGSRTRKSAA